ncbi:hypothetical protein [Terricaulis sp.]|uniref:hypothetical protein n=1 Tax=Terricaulis sp. TaxID=2768686 RepID=UPI003784F883
MLDRAALALVLVTAACAIAALAVFAGGGALYLWLQPTAGPAGAAGIVALLAFLIIAAMAVMAMLRSKQREREVEEAQAEVMEALPQGFTNLASDRPLLTLAASVIGGVLIARYPGVARDLMSVLARFNSRT